MNSLEGCDLVPPLYNTRAEDMWTQIEKKVDFTDRLVLDVGCGKADLMMRAWCAGARAVYGIDDSPIIIQDAKMRSLPLVKEGARLYFMKKNIEHWSDRWPGHHDIVICTSVLPYLLDPSRILKRIQQDSDTAVIECQYAGDGPGFEHIKNDDEMYAWLEEFDWLEIEKIGHTEVVSRNLKRTIWKCSNS